VLDVVQSFGNRTVNRPPLCGGVFIVAGRLGKDGDYASRNAEFKLVASFNTRFAADALGYRDFSFGFKGDGHRKCYGWAISFISSLKRLYRVVKSGPMS